jgi:hypothetical protein
MGISGGLRLKIEDQIAQTLLIEIDPDRELGSSIGEISDLERLRIGNVSRRSIKNIADMATIGLSSHVVCERPDAGHNCVGGDNQSAL